MPSIESPPCVEHEQVTATRSVWAWRMLCDFATGLDKLLKLGDFSRGDSFRD